MPYYLYRVLPFAQLEKLDQFDTFKLASVDPLSGLPRYAESVPPEPCWLRESGARGFG